MDACEYVVAVRKRAQLTAHIDRRWEKAWLYRQTCLVFDFAVCGHRFALDVKVRDSSVDFSVLARTDFGRRMLRNALIAQYPMVKADGERHALGRFGCDTVSPGEAIELVIRWLDQVIPSVEATIRAQTRRGTVKEGNVNLFWWDTRPNFGDSIGPWLISKLSGKRPINGRGCWKESPPIMSVGSILGLIEQDGTQVWGTGLIKPLDNATVSRLRDLQNVSVRAVRGKRTRDELIAKLGWDVPEVFGDPALLLPRFLPGASIKSLAGKVAMVPHYVHSAYLRREMDPEVWIVDVEQGLESVVREISSASYCVSTSLHGLIIAQAYGVPWLWLRVEDHPLAGVDFKFEDFFSTLEEEAVSVVSVQKQDLASLDIKALAKYAALPKMRISTDALLQSFPHEASESRHAVRAGTAGRKVVRKKRLGSLFGRREVDR